MLNTLKRNPYVATFLKYKDLLGNLISRDLKVKYRRSTLGFVWSVLNPLLMALVITAVFQTIFKFDVPNFAVYYLTGSLIFNFMNEATSGAMGSVVGSSSLIKKVYIPKYIFPSEKVMFAFVNMLFSMVALIIIMAITKFGWIGVASELKITWTCFLFFIPMIYTFVFSLGLGLILATLNVYFRDVSHIYSVLVMAWMYLTPIIYPMSAIEGSFVMKFIRFNPMYYYVEYFRSVVMYGTVPDMKTNVICIVSSLFFLVIGLIVFKKRQDKFILYI